MNKQRSRTEDVDKYVGPVVDTIGSHIGEMAYFWEKAKDSVKMRIWNRVCGNNWRTTKQSHIHFLCYAVALVVIKTRYLQFNRVFNVQEVKKWVDMKQTKRLSQYLTEYLPINSDNKAQLKREDFICRLHTWLYEIASSDFEAGGDIESESDAK